MSVIVHRHSHIYIYIDSMRTL